MVLLIDNYDSFVFNLARYVAELGYDYEVQRNDKITLAQIEQLKPSHIILSPGPCTPNEAGICLDLVTAFASKIPVLGVCLGHQAIAQAYGANIVKATQPYHGKKSVITHNGKLLFSGLANPLTVGRYHSLVVESSSVSADIIVDASTNSGEIMALHHQQYPLFGVQFHPESILTRAGHQLLQNFLNIT